MKIRIAAKNDGNLSTSQLILVHYEKDFRSFLSLPDGLNQAEKTYHGTVPLKKEICVNKDRVDFKALCF
jgi:hypothetical protein